MRAGAHRYLFLVLASGLAAASSALATAAYADNSGSTGGPNGSPTGSPTGNAAATPSALHHAHPIRHAALRSRPHVRYVSAALQCVPFARAESGIALKGNAANWWDAAAGVYARGFRPEAGAVLNFRATGGMRLGHVAVVTNVLGPREIEIDHANWTRYGASHGNVSLAMRVLDVSPANNWTAVRVELGHTGGFGAVYPTYGFIYGRPDPGVMVANTLATLHPTAERPALDADEVAEAPAGRSADIAPMLLPVAAAEHSLR